jgi:hypothetical protein
MADLESAARLDGMSAVPGTGGLLVSSVPTQITPPVWRWQADSTQEMSEN